MRQAASLHRKGNPLRLTITATTGESHISYLKKKLIAAHRMLDTHLTELSVALVGDKRMSDLHMRFMGISGSTDVLTFPLELDLRHRPTAGEVVVCVPEARRRAREQNTRVGCELLLYALHGMLHLSGWDDRTGRQFDRMHRMEDTILRRLGVGPVFAPKGRS